MCIARLIHGIVVLLLGLHKPPHHNFIASIQLLKWKSKIDAVQNELCVDQLAIFIASSTCFNIVMVSCLAVPHALMRSRTAIRKGWSLDYDPTTINGRELPLWLSDMEEQLFQTTPLCTGVLLHNVTCSCTCSVVQRNMSLMCIILCILTR